MTTAELDDDLTSTLLGEPDPDQYDTTDEYHQALHTWRENHTTTDLDTADRLARGLRRTQAKIGAIEHVAARQKAEIDRWVAKQVGVDPDTNQPARLAVSLEWYRTQLAAFHRAERERDPQHAKSISLPCGVTLTSSVGRVKTNIVDEPTAIAWLEQNAASTIRYPAPQIDKVELLKQFGAKAASDKAAGSYPAVNGDGEIVPGVELVRGETNYSVS